jgi:serine/threonine protein kinase/tetratricopeptide (TPR) repeat protein
MKRYSDRDSSFGNVAPSQSSRAVPPADECIEQLLDDMAEHWRCGEHLGVEAYLELHPWLRDQPETVLELIAEELNLRAEAGQEPKPEDFTRRFPLWERQVRALVECHQLMAARPARFPSAGDTLGDFHLRHELGRGAHGRVFIATQHSLADRYVVLKLTPRFGDEHLSLSRLLHSHIVPLYAAFDFPECGLRGLCQPYFGGATLAELQEMLRSIPVVRRSGNDLIQALTDIQLRRDVALPAGASNCRLLAESTYVEAVCRLLTCLADALHHAHERGLLHLDLKPSNVLLAADGQPMLLDFHLARPPLASGDAVAARLGGTPGYMSPEQTAMLAAAIAQQPAPAAVDRRADVYALGVLMYELLADEMPPSNAPGPALRVRNPRATPGLAAIVHHCLSSDPAGRYSTTRDLAVDLRRHLADLPLRGVAEHSLVERWRKWRRRRPYALPLLILLTAGAAAGGNWGTRLVRQHEAAESAAREGEESLQAGRNSEALQAFKYGAALVDSVPLSEGLSRRLRIGASRAERQLLRADLHALVEQLRPLDCMEWLSVEQIAGAEQQCRQLWERRTWMAENIGRSVGNESDKQVHDDLLDLAILYAHLHPRLRQPDIRAAHEHSLAILTEAEEICGQSGVLFRVRAEHARAAGQPEEAQAFARRGADLPPRGSWEHYALGRACAQSHDWRQAVVHYDRALALQPQSVWPQFACGIALYQLGEYAEAHLSFSVCTALAPSDASCVYNRGRTEVELGRLDRAALDFDRAAQLAPHLAPLVALSRADLHRRRRQFDQALAELEHARHGVAPAVVAYHTALIQLDRKDFAAAEASLRNALRFDPTHEQSRRLLERIRLTP